MIKGSTLIIAGFLIIMLGFFLVMVGSIWQTSTSNHSEGADSESEIKTGGVIMIGPIPIIFGSDKGMVYTGVFLALILMIVSYFLFYRR